MMEDSGFQIRVGHDELKITPIFIDQVKLENFKSWVTNPEYCLSSSSSCIINQYTNAHELYQQLNIPSDYKEIYISPDEQLNNLSFEALIQKQVKSDKLTDQYFLVKSKDIAYFHTFQSIICTKNTQKPLPHKLGVILNESIDSSGLIHHLDELKFLES